MHASLHQQSVHPEAEYPVFDAGAAYSAMEKILAQLIAFNTVKPNPTRPAMEWVRDFLQEHGVRVTLISSKDDPHNHTGLVATLGPWKDGGLAFSGHMDVVPVEGQKWDTDPFTLTEQNGLLYGRGTTDMKGFLACSLATMAGWAKAAHLFPKPLQLFLTYDEETGFVSVREMMAIAGEQFPRPAVAIIGEPTELNIVTAHKGTVVLTVDIATTQNGASAAEVTRELITFTRNLASATMHTSRNEAFNPPYTTFNNGVVKASIDDARAPMRIEADGYLKHVLVDITGQGCHSSTPALGISALNIAGDVVALAQKAGAGICVRTLHGGSAPNVVADKAQVEFLVDTKTDAGRTFLAALDDELIYIGAAHAKTDRTPVIRTGVTTPVNGTVFTADNEAEMKIQFRPLRADETDKVVTAFEAAKDRIAARTGATITISHRRIVPPLVDAADNPAREFVRAVRGDGVPLQAVSYGTEASVIQSEGRVPSVVCGPGNISIAHMANEFVDPAQLHACLAFQDRVVRQFLQHGTPS